MTCQSFIPPRARSALTLGCALLAAAAGAHAASLVIDDFSTGPYQSKIVKKGSESGSQVGTMVGGLRSTGLSLCATGCAVANPYQQPSEYRIGANQSDAHQHALVQTAGFDTAPRLDMDYGYGAPMNADFSAYDRVRLNFIGLSETLNFNLLMYTGAGRGQNGCNLLQHNGPFSIELPYSGFVMANGGFVAGDITFLQFIFQAGGAPGAVGYGLASIEVSDTPQAGAIVCSFT